MEVDELPVNKIHFDNLFLRVESFYHTVILSSPRRDYAKSRIKESIIFLKSPHLAIYEMHFKVMAKYEKTAQKDFDIFMQSLFFND